MRKEGRGGYRSIASCGPACAVGALSNSTSQRFFHDTFFLLLIGLPSVSFFPWLLLRTSPDFTGQAQTVQAPQSQVA